METSCLHSTSTNWNAATWEWIGGLKVDRYQDPRVTFMPFDDDNHGIAALVAGWGPARVEVSGATRTGVTRDHLETIHLRLEVMWPVSMWVSPTFSFWLFCILCIMLYQAARKWLTLIDQQSLESQASQHCYNRLCFPNGHRHVRLKQITTFNYSPGWCYELQFY